MNKLLWGVGLVAVAALLLSVVALVGGNQSVVREVVKEVRPVGGITNYDTLQANQSVTNGISRSWKQLSIPAGTSTVFWQNTTLNTVYVDSFAVQTSDTSSSTFRLWAVATVTPPLFGDTYVAMAPAYNRRIISDMYLGTSSPATSTSMARFTTFANPRNVTAGMVQVLPNEFVVLQLRAAASATDDGSIRCQAGGGCEYATSTNRGFNITAQFSYTSTSTAELPSAMR